MGYSEDVEDLVNMGGIDGMKSKGSEMPEESAGGKTCNDDKKGDVWDDGGL